MQHRETAEKVTETLLEVANKLVASVRLVDASEKDGKVSMDEADAYRKGVMGSLDELLQSTLTTIFATHPDLRPACSCASSASEDNNQP